jgi:hypothetical protein
MAGTDKFRASMDQPQLARPAGIHAPGAPFVAVSRGNTRKIRLGGYIPAQIALCYEV